MAEGTPPSGPESEGEKFARLLREWAEGDMTAGHELLDTYGDMVMRLCLQFSPSREDAEDACQESWIRICRARQRYDPAKSAPKTWIRMITERCLVDLFRKKEARVKLVATTDEGLERADAAELRKRLRQRVLEEFREKWIPVRDQLTPCDRFLVEAFYFEDWPHKRIAASLGITASVSRKQLSRILERIRGLCAEIEAKKRGREAEESPTPTE